MPQFDFFPPKCILISPSCTITVLTNYRNNISFWLQVCQSPFLEFSLQQHLNQKTKSDWLQDLYDPNMVPWDIKNDNHETVQRWTKRTAQISISTIICHGAKQKQSYGANCPTTRRKSTDCLCQDRKVKEKLTRLGEVSQLSSAPPIVRKSNWILDGLWSISATKWDQCHKCHKKLHMGEGRSFETWSTVARSFLECGHFCPMDEWMKGSRNIHSTRKAHDCFWKQVMLFGFHFPTFD